MSIEEVQASIVSYIQDAIESDEGIEGIYDKQLWLQIEDDQTREELHYVIVESYVKDLQDQEEIIDVMSLYILEKETLGENNWAQKGKELLSSMVE
ncbi:MAG: hypothetical protein ACD_66C00073G0002 [uncultured bacterium]|nr:MAG: hypothetical protein ACD_66C00073G0002 [uncultured bacterium]